MPTFTWRDSLTVSVREMSRTSALDCARQFDILVGLFQDYGELLVETDILAVLHAPAIVKFQGVILDSGTRHIVLGEDEAIDLTLPMTRESFGTLPMSLTELWIAAAITANEWLIETLKKILLPATPKTSEPKSASVPSSEPTPELPAMKTTG